MAGQTIETEVTPERARHPLTTYLPAATGGRSAYGKAAFNEDDELILMELPGEIEDSYDCAEEE